MSQEFVAKRVQGPRIATVSSYGKAGLGNLEPQREDKPQLGDPAWKTFLSSCPGHILELGTQWRRRRMCLALTCMSLPKKFWILSINLSFSSRKSVGHILGMEKSDLHLSIYSRWEGSGGGSGGIHVLSTGTSSPQGGVLWREMTQ